MPWNLDYHDYHDYLDDIWKCVPDWLPWPCAGSPSLPGCAPCSPGSPWPSPSCSRFYSSSSFSPTSNFYFKLKLKLKIKLKLKLNLMFTVKVNIMWSFVFTFRFTSVWISYSCSCAFINATEKITKFCVKFSLIGFYRYTHKTKFQHKPRQQAALEFDQTYENDRRRKTKKVFRKTFCIG